MLIDTHCHLEEQEYSNLDDLINEIFETNVGALIVSGYDVKTSNEAIALAHKYNNIYATVGFHPHDSGKITDEDYSLFDKWLLDDKVVGVGEIGLDYFYDLDQRDEQIEMFKRQLDIAVKFNKPVVIHNRNASADIYNILKDKKARGVIHCFNDNLEMATKFMDLGFYLGVGGIITFKNNNIKNVIQSVPLDYIVLETDSPYLTPEPHRGKQNSPLNLPLIAHAISNLKDMEYNEVATITTSNAKHIFDFRHDL